MTVKDTDHGYEALRKRLRGHASTVTVGVHEEEGSAIHEGGEATIAEIASFHEFGLGVPRRSFIADYVDENKTELDADIEKIGKALVEGKIASPEQGLDRFGLLQVGQVQQRIKAGISPELAPMTIAAKGSSTPLIDHGTLWSSIRHKVGGKK